jgi:hypothetical protein
MTGEMSKADLTEDGEWGLFVRTAKLLKAEIRPWDKYMGPYLLYHGHQLWFSNGPAGEWDHGIYDDTTDEFFSVSEAYGGYGFQQMSPADLARFIRKHIKEA